MIIKNMKYRLNYEWNGYEKGHMFESDPNGSGFINFNNGCIWTVIIDLLVKSGALTEIKEGGIFMRIGSTCSKCGQQYCTCPQRQSDGSWKEENKIEKIDTSGYMCDTFRINDLQDKVNEIIDFINIKLK